MSPDAKRLVLEHSNQLQECRLERVKQRKLCKYQENNNHYILKLNYSNTTRRQNR